MASYPSQQNLRELFDYSDGSLFHAKDLANNVRKGDHVGCLNSKGYLRTSVKGVQLLVHRLIWIWHHGSIPEGVEVDHVNRDKADNRIENLQLLPLKQHRAKDSREGSPNRGRKLPACVYERNGRYRVIKNKRSLGTFDTLEEAVQCLDRV